MLQRMLLLFSVVIIASTIALSQSTGGSIEVETNITNADAHTVLAPHISAIAQTGSTGAVMKVRDLKHYGVILIPPGDPRFEDGVGRALGDKRNSDVVNSVKRISLVVQNISNKAVIGYTLRWQFKYPDGTTTLRRANYVQPAALLDGNQAKYPKDLPGSITILSGRERLVSQLASLGMDSKIPPGTARFEQHIEEFAAFIDRSSEIFVTLDSVLFEDGTVAGPDEAHFFGDFVKCFDAVQDLYRRIVQLHEDGAADSEITAWVSQQNDVMKTFVTDQSDFERNVAAKEFLTIADRFGTLSAIQLAKSNLYARRPAFKRIDQ